MFGLDTGCSAWFRVFGLDECDSFRLSRVAKETAGVCTCRIPYQSMMSPGSFTYMARYPWPGKKMSGVLALAASLPITDITRLIHLLG